VQTASVAPTDNYSRPDSPEHKKLKKTQCGYMRPFDKGSLRHISTRKDLLCTTNLREPNALAIDSVVSSQVKLELN